MNAFVCRVVSYSEVNSRDYTSWLAINEFVCSVMILRWNELYLKISSGTIQERTETGVKVFVITSFQVYGWTCKKGRNGAGTGWENSTALPYYGTMAASFLASNTMHLHPYTVKTERWYLWQGNERHCKRKWTSCNRRCVDVQFNL